MISKVTKAYYLFFYKLYCFFKTLDELGTGFGLLEWRAAVIIQTLQIFILFIISNEIEVFYHRETFSKGNPMIWIIPIAIALAFFNYYTFLYHDKWKNFEDEFKCYTKRKRVITSFIALLTVIGIPVLLIFSFFQYSYIH